MADLAQSITLSEPLSNPSVQTETDWVDKHFLHRGYGLEFEMEARWIQKHLPSGDARIADIGCGIGALFDVIGKNRTLGIDYSYKGLNYTHQRYPVVPLFCAQAETLPFADKSLDALTVQHVIEHLEQYEQAVREWFRVLKPGGILLVVTPNDQYSDPSVFDDKSHVHIFNHKDLNRVMQQCGFDLIDLRSLGLPWFRNSANIPAGWRLRRMITGFADWLSRIPFCIWRGQTLCSAARRPF